VSDRPESHLSEEDAAQLWQRAAALQAEAARQAEAEARHAVHGELSTSLGDDGYQLQHVRAAAVEAGISEEYLDAALADVRAEAAIKKRKPANRFARRFLSDPPDAITVRRVIDAPVEKVLRTMEEIFPHEPYRLTLTDRQGDPLGGGFLVFNIDGASYVATEGFTGQASGADLRQVIVTLRPLVGDGADASCEVTLRGPVAWAYTLNSAIGTVFAGLSGGIGLGASWVGSGAVAAALVASGVATVATAGVLAAGVTVAGTVGGSLLGTRGFRALYALSLRKGQKALEGLLSLVAVKAQGGWGIAGSSDNAAARLGSGDERANEPGAETGDRPQE
jgi:hypothetical protein